VIKKYQNILGWILSVLTEIHNFDAIDRGFSDLEIRYKKKTNQTSITIFFKKWDKTACCNTAAVFDLCNLNYVVHKTFFIYQRIWPQNEAILICNVAF
jgi:hypothetical protein